MKLPRPLALQYVARLLVGAAIAWYGLRWLGVADPTWAVVSLIVVTEPELRLARANFLARSINTLTGCFVACLALLVLGATPVAMLLSIALSVLIANGVSRYPSNWRLAPATAALLVTAGFGHSTIAQELDPVLRRAGEVLAGGGVALVLAYAETRAVRGRPSDSATAP